MDLSKVIQDAGLRFDYVASHLFPGNQHPYNALNRVIAKGGKLNSSQLVALSGLTGQSVDALLGLPYTGTLDKSQIVLRRGDFVVTYIGGSASWVLEKSQKGVLQTVAVYAVEKNATVKEFLARVDIEISKLY